MENGTVTEMFTGYREFLLSENEVYEKIRSITAKIVEKNLYLTSEFQNVHSCKGSEYEKSICDKLDAQSDSYIELYRELAEVLPKSQFFKYRDSWKCCTQHLIFLIAFKTFLLENRLVRHEEVSNYLKVPLETDGFHIDIEEYLCGLLFLGNELSRLAVNSVTAGDLDRPCIIFEFLSSLSKGFRMLNLKNDFLRKKFDGLKYDLKKVEEVMYDLSVRNMKDDSKRKKAEDNNNISRSVDDA